MQAIKPLITSPTILGASREIQCFLQIRTFGDGQAVAAAPAARRNGIASDVVTLFRIVLALGVRDRARGEFWRYLRHALTRHREKFAEAMRLAAVGYHFRKLTED